MRIVMSIVPVCGLALIMAGCATAPQPAAAPAATSHVVPVSQLSAEEIVNLKRLGYKLVDNNGETLFCHTDTKLGSHLQHDNTCLTEREMIALREETQRRLQYITTQVPPMQGK
jgi:hypothetical protein